MPNCRVTGEKFEIREKDKKFYELMDVPAPKDCPKVRMQHRMAFRNESSLYHRKCDLTGKQIISVHRPEVPFPVYYYEEWFGDKWDAKDYGQEYDFNKPFFEQFLELRNKVPHNSLIFSSNVNCDYCNLVGSCKNCYLCFGSVYCEDCYYGSPFKCKDCIDSVVLRESQLCIGCMDSYKLYNCYECQNCSNSSELKFCIEVHNSKNCFACVGLNQKEYCILNQQYSKEEYEKFMAQTDLCDPVTYKRITDSLEHLRLKQPHKYYVGNNNENVTGDYIFNSKDCVEIFYGEKCQDVAYSFQLHDVQDCQDVSNAEFGHHCYQVSAHYNQVSNSRYCYYLWDNIDNLTYCGNCTQNVKDCFGCEGLKHAQYCILNKQYTKEEYEELVPRIIEHMKSTGEWGEFFPGWISAYGYNETVAHEYYPLTKEEALKLGYNWYDNVNEGKYIGPKVEIPKNVDEVKSDFCNKILICDVSGKPYKILPKELEAYKKLHVPIPRRCPKQRHLDRLAKRNPMQLWDRTCAKTGEPFKTTYAPDRPEIIYSEKAYLDEVY